MSWLPMLLILGLGQTVRSDEAKPAPEINALFQRTDGWIGGDGAYSVDLGKDRTAWLFSDTWIGKVEKGSRKAATIVNNTLAIQTGKGKDSKMEFIVRKGADGKPLAFIAPADGHGWFWLQSGVAANDKLYLFLMQIEKTKGSGVFNFRHMGQWLGIVANPEDPPLDWRVEQRKVPAVAFDAKTKRNFGAAILRVGEDLFIYGTDDSKGGLTRTMVTARVPVAKFEDFAQWRFLTDAGWQSDPDKCRHQCPGIGSEYSVSYLTERRQFIVVTSEFGMSDRIVCRTAPSPEGPWSVSRLLYKCPEPALDKKIFCYAGKAHAHLAGPRELLISYATNSFDFWQVARDARIYWPYFVRAKVD